MSGGRWAGRFVVGGEIGRGGIARVFEARDEATGATVALKELLPHLAEQRVVRERFRREVLASRRLQHPAIVRVFDLHEEGDRMFLSMEIVPGRDLAEELRASGPLPRAARLATVLALLDALECAHGAGVVHRDLKPANVMRLPDGSVKVLDFGLARVDAVVGLTSHSTMLGTPDYMAPEAVAGLPVDGRADLYSLGVLWYELCTGRMPFSAPSAFALFRKMAEEDGPAPAGGDVDAVEADTVASLLRCDAARRPVSSSEVRARLLGPAPAVEVVAARLCPWCGAEDAVDTEACLACGAARHRPSRRGDALLVLVRRQDGGADARDVLIRIGAEPDPSRDVSRALQTLPAVLLGGLDAQLAAAIQRRMVGQGLVAEVRTTAERNFDLLHRSGTPGVFLVAGLLASWAAAAALAWWLTGVGGAVAVLLLGPAGAWWLERNAHQLVPPLFTLVSKAPPSTRLSGAWQEFVARQPSPPLRQLGQSVVVRAHLFLAEVARADLPAGVCGPIASEAVQAATDALAALGEAVTVEGDLARDDGRRAVAEIERAEAQLRRVGTDPVLEALLEARRGDAHRSADLEERRTRYVQRVLAILAGLEADRRALVTAREPSGVTRGPSAAHAAAALAEVQSTPGGA